MGVPAIGSPSCCCNGGRRRRVSWARSWVSAPRRSAGPRRRPRRGVDRGGVRRRGVHDRVRRATVPAPLPGGARRRRVPAAVRSRDPGDLPPGRHARAAVGHDRERRRRVHHPHPGARAAASTCRAHRQREDRAMTETTMPSQADQLASLGRYEYGWADSDVAGASARRGLNDDVVRDISAKKNEPSWMLDLRLKGLRLFNRKPLPAWGADLSAIDFDDIKYFVRSTEAQAASWDDLPADIKNTYDRLGIPEAEKQRLIAGVAAQYESEVVYHKVREDLEEQGVLFLDTDTALKEHEELFREHWATVIPPNVNKFAALNSAVWSGGSFIWIPEGVHVEIPLQAYFRINSQIMGQFERTLIIAEPGSSVHYVEGCTAPIYSSDSLHSAVVEIIVKPHAKVRYTTIQNS